MTAQELATTLAEKNPSHRWAYDTKGETVAFWSDEIGGFNPYAGLLITGDWGAYHHVLVNGQKIKHDWIEV